MLIAEYGGLAAENPQLAIKIEVCCVLNDLTPFGSFLVLSAAFTALPRQEQNIAHTQLQKKLRTPLVRSGFEDSTEVRSWNLLKGTYFPTLMSSLSDLREQLLPLHERIRGFAELANALVEMQQMIKKQKSSKMALSNISLANQVWTDQYSCWLYLNVSFLVLDRN